MWHAGWDELFTRSEWGKYPGEELIRFVARNYYAAPDRRAVRFLEIGSGTGANLWYLAREGFAATGLDGSSVALERARTRFAGENLAVELTLGDALNLPYPDASFDCVLDVECLCANSFADARRVLDEAHRVLRPGGRIYSKTFMTGLTGSEQGRRLPGERNTFLEMQDGPFQAECGLIRLMDEDEIPDLYGRFGELQWEYIKRTAANRAVLIGEWVITGRRA